MNYYDHFRHENEQEKTLYQQPVQSTEAVKKSGGLSRHTVVAIAIACILSSSVVGFGGGMLASTISRTESTAAPAAGENETASLLTAGPDSTSGVMTVSQIASTASDSVVEITTQVLTTGMMMQPVTGEGAGSGVILSSDGYIVTNNHVISDAQSIRVRLKNGESYPATLVGTDEQTDVAVIKIDAAGLKAAQMGDSSALQVGDEAVAIGNPLGELGGTVTNGIISALDREITVGGETMNLLQTNAAINPGNSGGGLFNAKGELIGIVVAKSSGSDIEGLGFAIPIDDAKSVISDLMSTGYVTGRGELGISVVDVQDAQTAFMYRVSQPGTYVGAVSDFSAAQKAGLQVGDRILSVNDKEISSAQELKTALQKCSAGDTVTLSVMRDGQEMTLSAILQESVPEDAGTDNPAQAA